MGRTSQMSRPSMKHVTQVSVWRYVVYYEIFFSRSHYLGSQLKFLYVAITRARNNLWIVDSSESAEPMKVPEDTVILKNVSPFVQVYWSSKGQIEVWSSTDEIPHLAVASTPEEWSKTGKKSALVFGIVVRL